MALSKLSLADLQATLDTELEVPDIEGILENYKSGKIDAREAQIMFEVHLEQARVSGQVLLDGDELETMSVVEWERDNLTLFASAVITGIMTRGDSYDLRENAVLAWDQAKEMLLVGRELMTNEDGEVSFLITPDLKRAEMDKDEEPTLG